MKTKFAVPKKLVVPLVLALSSSFVFAQTSPVNPDPNPTLYGQIYSVIAMDDRVQDVVDDYYAQQEQRFEEHMEIARIASPSRQEYYRAKALYDRLIAFGFPPEQVVFTGAEGTMKGSAVQQVDGLRVYQTCAIIPGTWNETLGSYQAPDPLLSTPNSPVMKTVYARPKVVIEGHIDTVNPATIPEFTADMPMKEPIPFYFESVKLQPIWNFADDALNAVVSTPDELAGLKDQLSFEPKTGLVVKDKFWDQAKKTYRRLVASQSDNWTYDEKQARRIYVPGYSDAIGNTIGVYHMAKLFKTYDIKPVYDIWFCFTAGEEGRGNLAGMKQLYGYNQQNAAPVPGDNGKNKLNIVANLSIDGGPLLFNYLGSYRYEVNYKGVDGALEAARRIAQIADVRSPTEDGTFPDDQRTTYTVGIAYKKADGSTSFEIDMRAPTAPPLNDIKGRLFPKFGVGETTAEGTVISQLWFGDRPPHVRSAEKIKEDPLLYAAWMTYRVQVMNQGKTIGVPKLDLDPEAGSVNDNIPGAMDIPTINLDIHQTAAGGGGHTFNEWGVRGLPDLERNNMSHVLYTLLAVSGLANANGVEIVPPAYSAFGPRHTNDVWDAENMWQ